MLDLLWRCVTADLPKRLHCLTEQTDGQLLQLERSMHLAEDRFKDQ